MSFVDKNMVISFVNEDFNFQSNGRVASTQKQTYNFQFPFDISDENNFFYFWHKQNLQFSIKWDFNFQSNGRVAPTREQASVEVQPVIFRNHDNFIRSFRFQILIILSSGIHCNSPMSSSGVRLVTLQRFHVLNHPNINDGPIIY